MFTKKKGIALLLLVILLASFWMMVRPVEAAAKSMTNMSGVTWDLAPGKTITYYSYLGGSGFIKQKAKITNYSTKWANSDHSMITMNFSVNFTRAIKPSDANIKKIANYYKKHTDVSCNPRCYVAIVDKKSGKSLMNANSKNVAVSLNWDTLSKKTFKASGKKITLSNTRANVTVTFPKSYTGLCIGIGGWTCLKKPANDAAFWRGEIPFWKMTGRYSTKKKVAHFSNPTFSG